MLNLHLSALLCVAYNVTLALKMCLYNTFGSSYSVSFCHAVGTQLRQYVHLFSSHEQLDLDGDNCEIDLGSTKHSTFCAVCDYVSTCLQEGQLQ